MYVYIFQAVDTGEVRWDIGTRAIIYRAGFIVGTDTLLMLSTPILRS